MQKNSLALFFLDTVCTCTRVLKTDG